MEGSSFDTFQLFYPARRACALRALGLLLADGALTMGRGKPFYRSTGYFYENSRNSGTEIAPKVGNERSLLGLQMGR